LRELTLARILPGVEIQVIKEIVPQQLHPSGVVGLIGTAEKGPALKPIPVTSYRELTDKFGADATYSLLKDARLSFLNGVFEVYATRIEAEGGGAASATLKNENNENLLGLQSKAPGEVGNKVKLSVLKGSAKETFMFQVTNGVVFEVWDNLVMDTGSDLYAVKVLNSNSTLLSAKDLTKPAKPPKSLIPSLGEVLCPVASPHSPRRRTTSRPWRCLSLRRTWTWFPRATPGIPRCMHWWMPIART